MVKRDKIDKTGKASFSLEKLIELRVKEVEEVRE
jgi:hypothetical protein